MPGRILLSHSTSLGHLALPWCQCVINTALSKCLHSFLSFLQATELVVRRPCPQWHPGVLTFSEISVFHKHSVPLPQGVLFRPLKNVLQAFNSQPEGDATVGVCKTRHYLQRFSALVGQLLTCGQGGLELLFLPPL